MTSRVSYINLLKQNLKNHLASLLILIFAFLIHLIGYFLQVQNLITYASRYRDPLYLGERLVGISGPNPVNGLMALGIGIFLAYDYFKYLHSKKQIDLYESLPITRNMHFNSLYITSISIFTLLCLITTGTEYLIVATMGYGSTALLKAFFWNFICMIAVFMASYVTGVLAMVMTGHSIVAGLGYCVFTVYVPFILNYLIPSFASCYFDTFHGMPVRSLFNEINLSYCFSPLSLAALLTFDTQGEWLLKDYSNYFVAIWIFIILITFLSYRLFKKRECESANRAMAFEKVNSIIRIMLVIPLSLYLGLFMKSVSANESDAWLIFGIAFGGFLIHGIIEGIFQFDIKAMFSKKRQLLFSLIVCFGFFTAFKFDIFKFDMYVPEAGKVQKIEFNSDEMSFACGEYFGDHDKKDHITDKETITLALQAIEDICEIDGQYEDEDKIRDWVTVTYTMKNGTKKFRSYDYDCRYTPESLNVLAKEPDYKDDLSAFFKEDVHTFDEFVIRTGITQTKVISGDEMDELIEIYLEDFTALTFEDIREEVIACSFEGYLYREEYDYTHTYSFPVYACYENTLNYIDTHGVIEESEFEQMVRLEIYPVDEYDDRILISDQKTLLELKEHIQLQSYNIYYYNEKFRYGYLTLLTKDKEEIGYDIFISAEILDEIL